MAIRAVAVAVSLLLTASVFAGEPTAENEAFLELRIRPVLVNHCYECQFAEAADERQLLLDTAFGRWRVGAGSPALVPCKPEASLLIQALRYEDLEMPPGGKLLAEVVSDLVKKSIGVGRHNE